MHSFPGDGHERAPYKRNVRFRIFGLMIPFLARIADDLIEKHGQELRDVWIILPGKRAGLFLRKYLAQKLGRSFFAPQIFTLPDFISKHAGALYSFAPSSVRKITLPFAKMLKWL